MRAHSPYIDQHMLWCMVGLNAFLPKGGLYRCGVLTPMVNVNVGRGGGWVTGGCLWFNTLLFFHTYASYKPVTRGLNLQPFLLFKGGLLMSHIFTCLFSIDLLGYQSWQYVNFITWIVFVEDGIIREWFWLGTLMRHRMSKLSIAMHWHGLLVQVHGSNPYGMVEFGNLK